MIYEMQALIDIARYAVGAPRGMGDSELSKHSESWAPYYRFLSLVVSTYRPHVCLETGVYLGTATAHMAAACKNTMVIGVDRDFHKDVGQNTDRFPNIFLVEGDTTSEDTMYKVSNTLAMVDPVNRERIGVMFVDSTHDGETPRKEVELYSRFFDVECLIVCDDLIGPRHLHEKMMEFWEWLPGEKQELHFLHPRLNTSYDEPGFGICIVRRQ